MTTDFPRKPPTEPLTACAAMVQRGDPDRFAATMAAPPASRQNLWPIYAFNLEIARAPWVTEQPLIAEMRLQFWRDMLTAPTPRAHDIARPLHALIQQTPAIAPLLDRVIEARRHDITRDPFASEADFDAYIEDTSATLLWAAALTLGASPDAEAPIRALGWAQGLANYLRAVPTLVARNLQPLPNSDPDHIRAWAAQGLANLETARAARRSFGPAAPAALAAWQTAPLLRQVFANPTRVAEGTLAVSEFAKRGGLLWMALTGRF